jgi:peptide methionine sulfoxide reductase msrA/msrB
MRFVKSIPLILVVALIAALGFASQSKTAKKETAMTHSSSSSEKIQARVIGADGTLTEPVHIAKKKMSDEDWRQELDSQEFNILRQQGTERAFTGDLLKNHKEGIYTCRGCGLPLFPSETKFDSGTGWPSFYAPVGPTNVLERSDQSHGMVRTEVLCPRCEGHLGHVFEDGPQPTGLRYCMNSASLDFVANEDLKSAAEPVASEPESASGTAQVVIAGGCFWCVEGVFEQVEGVLDAESGYAGGTAETANYQAVCGGDTGHAEAVRLTYNPAKVSLERLLEIHFATHDPTTLNRQGADTGTQYRSAIFYANPQEKEVAEKVIAHLSQEKKFGSPIVTTLEPLVEFFPAETYHQNFVCNNPGHPYIQAVAQPKVDKVKKIMQEAVESLGGQ